MISSPRWHVKITYDTERGPLVVEHDVIELEDLHDVVELGPAWGSILDIHVQLAPTYTDRGTVEFFERQ